MLRDKPWWRGLVWIELLAAAIPSAFHYRSLLRAGDYPWIVTEQYIWIGAIAAAAAVGLAGVRQRSSRIGWGDFLLLGLAIPLIAWWVLDRGMLHIGGYEQSVLANYGWMMFRGMKPQVDFPCTLCPHFYLGLKYAYTWFGVAWRSNVILAAIYAAVSFAWAYFLLRSMDLPRTSAALVALLGQSLCLMMGCCFWYNSVGSTDATLLFLAALAWADRPRSKLLLASVTVALGLVMLDKPNGWVLPVCLAVGFLGSREHRVRFGGCVLGAAGIVCAVAYFGPFDVVATLRMYYRLAGSRPPGMEAVWHSLNFETWHGPIETGKLFVFTATFLGVAAARLWAHRTARRPVDGRWWAKLWAYAGALSFGAASFFTNFETKCVDLAVPAVAFALWVAKCEPWKTDRVGNNFGQIVLQCAAWLCLFILCQGLLNGWSRYRIYYSSPNDFWQRQVSDESPVTAYMAGVRGSPRLVRFMEELNEAVSKYPEGQVFLGPFIEFAYPAIGRKPPEGFPVWWHPRISYFPEDAALAVNTFRERRIDTLIFLTGNFTQMPEEIPRRLGEWYAVDEVGDTITIYRPRAKE